MSWLKLLGDVKGYILNNIYIYILNYYTHFTVTQNLGKHIFYICE